MAIRHYNSTAGRKLIKASNHSLSNVTCTPSYSDKCSNLIACFHPRRLQFPGCHYYFGCPFLIGSSMIWPGEVHLWFLATLARVKLQLCIFSAWPWVSQPLQLKSSNYFFTRRCALLTFFLNLLWGVKFSTMCKDWQENGKLLLAILLIITRAVSHSCSLSNFLAANWLCAAWLTAQYMSITLLFQLFTLGRLFFSQVVVMYYRFLNSHFHTFKFSLCRSSITLTKIGKITNHRHIESCSGIRRLLLSPVITHSQ